MSLTKFISKRTKFSFEIVVMSLSDNVNFMFYSAILKRQLKSICPELERTSFYKKLNYILAVRVWAKENLPAFEILRVE